jgi:hypothetical protein
MGATMPFVALTEPRALTFTVWVWNIILAGVTAWNSYVNLRDHLEERKHRPKA